MNPKDSQWRYLKGEGMVGKRRDGQSQWIGKTKLSKPTRATGGSSSKFASN